MGKEVKKAETMKEEVVKDVVTVLAGVSLAEAVVATVTSNFSWSVSC